MFLVYTWVKPRSRWRVRSTGSINQQQKRKREKEREKNSLGSGRRIIAFLYVLRNSFFRKFTHPRNLCQSKNMH